MFEWLIGFALLELVIFLTVWGFTWADDIYKLDFIETDLHKNLVIFTVCIAGGGFVSIGFFVGLWWMLA